VLSNTEKLSQNREIKIKVKLYGSNSISFFGKWKNRELWKQFQFKDRRGNHRNKTIIHATDIKHVAAQTDC